MDIVATIQLDARPATLEALRALRHKTETYALRTYLGDGAAKDDLLVQAQGTKTPLKSWVTADVPVYGTARATLSKRRAIPPPYVDFSTLRVARDGVVRDVLITHRLLIRVHEDLDTVQAVLTCGADLPTQLQALADTCKAAGIPVPCDGVIVKLKNTLSDCASISAAVAMPVGES